MDRFALEHNLRNASARIVACQEALLLQRFQVRELERGGLDASLARALLEIYEEIEGDGGMQPRQLGQHAQDGGLHDRRTCRVRRCLDR